MPAAEWHSAFDIALDLLETSSDEEPEVAVEIYLAGRGLA